MSLTRYSPQQTCLSPLNQTSLGVGSGGFSGHGRKTSLLTSRRRESYILVAEPSSLAGYSAIGELVTAMRWLPVSAQDDCTERFSVQRELVEGRAKTRPRLHLEDDRVVSMETEVPTIARGGTLVIPNEKTLFGLLEGGDPPGFRVES